MDTSIKDDGSVFVDDHLIGQLDGLAFRRKVNMREAKASDLEAKAVEAVAVKAVTAEVDRRLTSLSSGQHAIFTLSDEAIILWGGMSIGRIAKSGSIFSPDVEVIGGELGHPTLRQMAEDRMRQFLRAEVETHLQPLKKLKELQEKPDILPSAKDFAFTLLEHHGSLDRQPHGKRVRDLGQEERRELRSVGVQFGQYNVFIPDLMKPRPARLLSLLNAYGAGGDHKPFIPFAGVTSIPNDGELKSDNFAPHSLSLAGYRAVGPRIVRFDILNRMAMQIRDAQSQFEKIALDKPKRPTFQIMSEMLALLGASLEETRGVLEALGFKPFTADSALEKPVLEKPVEDRPDAEAPKAEEAPSPDAATAETAAPDMAATEAPKTETSAPAPPPTPAEADTPKPPKRNRDRQRSSLTIYVPSKPLEDGPSRDGRSLEYWTLPPRQPRGPWRDDKGGQNKGRRKPPDYKGRSLKPPRSYSGNKPQRSAKSIENSPFAALAALKTTDDKKGDKS